MIYPMFFMVVVTLSIGIVALFTRIKSIKQGDVMPRDYKLMNSDKFPDYVTQATRCFNNQFEVPVLFYVACLSVMVLNLSGLASLCIAWAFVFARIAHAYVHLTYNNLLHRLAAFWVSVVLVLMLWLFLLVSAF